METSAKPSHSNKFSSNRRFISVFHATGTGKLFMLIATIILAWFYKAIQPPPSHPCGSPLGPPVTSPRVQLHDGRYLAYKEEGVSKKLAKYKIVFVHGFGGSRHDILPVSESLVQELRIYLVGYDRAGYGQTDPNPGRTIQSDAHDLIEFADVLGLGSKFYVIATSIGGYTGWGCLKYSPERLAGMAMLAPVTNYWWSDIPFLEAYKAFRTQPFQDQIATSVAHYLPWLTYWWNEKQKLFPKSSVVQGKMGYLNSFDKKYIANLRQNSVPNQATQQGTYESLYRDMTNMFGRWSFNPGDLENPFSENETKVHIWHGDEDNLVPLILQQHVHERLPWVQLHVVAEAGHFLSAVRGLPDQIIRTLLLE